MIDRAYHEQGEQYRTHNLQQCFYPVVVRMEEDEKEHQNRECDPGMDPAYRPCFEVRFG